MLAIATSTIFVACKKGEEKKETNVSSNKPTNNLNRQIDGLNIKDEAFALQCLKDAKELYAVGKAKEGYQ